MATKVLTKGKQVRVAGKTHVGGLGFWAGATLKKTTLYIIKGQKSNTAIFTRRPPERVADKFL
jgi:hypothetical protein